MLIQRERKGFFFRKETSKKKNRKTDKRSLFFEGTNKIEIKGKPSPPKKNSLLGFLLNMFAVVNITAKITQAPPTPQKVVKMGGCGLRESSKAGITIYCDFN